MATRARKRMTNRQKRDEQVAARLAADPLDDVTGRELLAVLDDELQNLPENGRDAVVLCYLQGLTRDEAARRLGCSESTLKRRLEAGKNALRQRLTRRGLALPAALLASGVATAAVPARLTAATAQAAAGTTAVSAPVAALVRSSLRAMSVGGAEDGRRRPGRAHTACGRPVGLCGPGGPTDRRGRAAPNGAER